MIAIIAGPTAVCPYGESGGDPSAINYASTYPSVGLAQISTVHGWSIGWLLNPQNNIAAAHEVWSWTHDFRAWSCAS